MLQDAILIISTINGDLQYSSMEKQICPTAESYMNQWFSSFLPEENQNLDLQQQLQLVQEELYFARPQELLEQWLQARIDFDRQRQQLVAARTVRYCRTAVCVIFLMPAGEWTGHWTVCNQYAGYR